MNTTDFTFEINEETLDMIRDLSDVFGPSGFEDDVLTVLRKYGQNLGSFEEDKVRNLYLYREENTGKKPVFQLDAHSDEVGFMVHSIKPNGTLRFVSLGGWNINTLSSSTVLVRNKEGEYLPGIIAAKPVHFMKASEREKGIQDISDLVIDMGACSAEEVTDSFGIRIGEPAVPATSFSYDKSRDIMAGKAFDCRIGCAVILEALRRLQGEELPFDIVATFSSQEEVGDRGVRVSVNHVNPDISIVLEGCPADDTFTESYAIQTALRKGPMLRFMDRSVICSPRFQRYALDLAEAKGIPVQASVREGGGNNGAVINLAGKGVPVIVAGVPVRYIHSMNGFTTWYDFEATVQLVIELLRSIDSSVYDTF